MRIAYDKPVKGKDAEGGMSCERIPPGDMGNTFITVTVWVTVERCCVCIYQFRVLPYQAAKYAIMYITARRSKRPLFCLY